MSFPQAVATCLRKYVTFTGRARRSEYWWFFLFCFLVGLVAAVLDYLLFDPLLGDQGPLETLTSLALFLPSLAVGARRLHDTGRSGWWQLLVLIPVIGWIILLIWWCSDSHAAPNQHGPSPKDSEYGGLEPMGSPTAYRSYTPNQQGPTVH